MKIINMEVNGESRFVFDDIDERFDIFDFQILVDNENYKVRIDSKPITYFMEVTSFGSNRYMNKVEKLNIDDFIQFYLFSELGESLQDCEMSFNLCKLLSEENRLTVAEKEYIDSLITSYIKSYGDEILI